MNEETADRTSLSERIGLSPERVRVGSTSFVIEPRDVTLFPDRAEPPYPTVVGLHGMAMRIEILARWIRGMTDEGCAWLLPEGPYPLERKMGRLRMIGHAWYLYEGDTPAFRRSLRESEDRLLRLIDRRATTDRLDRDRMLLLGFSQGGYFAGSVGLRHAERFRGIAVAGGRIRIGFADRDIREIPRIPILFLHGTDDDVVPIDKARESAAELEEHGFPVRFEEIDGGHEWNDAMEAAFRAWAAPLLEIEG
ncbi:MAG: hypothetical protein GF346_01335 [Candidatus Eisenbacteria bacterium]|nr:hypothetical protein [Candidatus Latescibacterota bacterium]MBD3301073.1 hypothetical protein [Candidatus Eisenbacteria bacterium]